MSVAGPPQDAGLRAASGGSAEAELANEAASVRGQITAGPMIGTPGAEIPGRTAPPARIRTRLKSFIVPLVPRPRPPSCWRRPLPARCSQTGRSVDGGMGLGVADA